MEEAAPAWLPIVFLAIPVVIVGGVLMAFAGTRRRAKADKQQRRSGRQAAEVALGSAASIDDATQLAPEAMLKALAVVPESDEYDEGEAGKMLGLQARISQSVHVLEPHVYWGERDGRQVFIRVGPDEKTENGTTMGTNRHSRQITVLRVASPEFTLDDWLKFVHGETPELAGALASVDKRSSIWDGSYAHGGAEGIVLTRSAVTGPGYWAYDLWLAERIARMLDLPALAPEKIGPSWTVPYELGRKFSV